MDKNTILGLLLMGVVIFGFSMLNSGDDQSNQPTTEKTEKADAKQATTDIADSPATPTSLPASRPSCANTASRTATRWC